MYIELFNTMINWPTQLCGTIGFIIMAVAYQQKKVGFLITQSIAYVCFIGEAAFLLLESNTYANIIMTGISLLRNVLMIVFLKKWNKELPSWIAFVALAGAWVGSAFFFDEWYSYLPPILLTIYTLAAIQKNYYILKIGALILEGTYIIYHFKTGAYVGAIRQVVLVISIISSMAIMAYKQYKAKHSTTLSESSVTIITNEKTISTEQTEPQKQQPAASLQGNHNTAA